MKRPCIGITKSINRGLIAYWLTALAILLVGGKPIIITVRKPRLEISLDGLIIGGGKDIFPQHYDGQIKSLYPYELDRDELELKWLLKCQTDNVPVLGICRGAQLMNVSRNGTLVFDLQKAYEKASYPSGLWAKIFFRKKIIIKEDTLLFKILKINIIKVNSSHTQSIDKVGMGLVVTSNEENKIVQSIEDPSKDFFLGVQFHPEFLIYSEKFLNIFRALVTQAKKNLHLRFFKE